MIKDRNKIKRRTEYYFYNKPLQLLLLLLGFYLGGNSWYEELIKDVAIGYNEWLNFLPMMLIIQIFLQKTSPPKWRISKVVDQDFTCNGLILLIFFSCYNMIYLFSHTLFEQSSLLKFIVVIANVINLAVLWYTLYFINRKIELFQKHQLFLKFFSVVFIGAAVYDAVYGIIENLAMIALPLLLFAIMFFFELLWFFHKLYRFIFFKEFEEKEYRQYDTNKAKKEPFKWSIKFDKGLLVQVIMIAIILSGVYALYQKYK